MTYIYRVGSIETIQGPKKMILLNGRLLVNLGTLEPSYEPLDRLVKKGIVSKTEAEEGSLRVIEGMFEEDFWRDVIG